MEPEDDGWWNELRKYIRSVENLTVEALKRIKRGRSRKNLPFDEAFQKYFLQKTNARIADVYADFLVDENLESGQSPSHQDVNQPSYENGMANIFEMPVVLEQLNNRNAGTATVQNDNETSEQIVISIPSNSLLIPLQMDLNENSEHESRGSGESQLLNVSDPNKGAGKEKQNAVGGGGLAIESTSTSVDNSEFSEQLERMVNSKMLQPDTIDLTTDQEEANSVSVGRPNDNALQNVQKTKNSRKNDVRTSNKAIIPNTQILPSNAQRRLETDLNSEPPFSIDTAQANISHHSEIIMPSNANGLELTVRDGAANVQIDEDNLQSRLAVLSKIQNALHSHGTLSGARGGGDGNRRYDKEMAVEKLQNMQHSEFKDLISDDEDDVNQAVNGFPKDMQIVADQVQPTARGQKRGDDNAIAIGHLEKKSKLTVSANTKKRHKCDFCEYSTLNKSHLNYHIRTHTNERPHRCEVCGKRFILKENLTRHMKTHRDMFAFQCSNCRQGFSDETKWKLHESRCNARGYECHLCKKVFIRKHHLVDHMRKHTGEKLRCMKCRKQFSSNDCLVRHMKSHGNLFRFQCSKCRLGFSKKAPWKLHESRCKSKQYECFLCGKKFHQSKSHLLRHMCYKHTSERPFGCSHCPLRFVQKSQLTLHTKLVHSKDI